MAPKPHPKYDDGDSNTSLYIAHDRTSESAHVIKFGITRSEPSKRLNTIKAGFRELLKKNKRAKKEIMHCYGEPENWVIDRVWRFNSREAAKEAEKLSVALALRKRGTRPLGSDYVDGLTYSEAERAVEWSITRIRQSTPPGKFKLSVKSARRIPKRGASNGGEEPGAPPKPFFGKPLKDRKKS